MNIKDVTQPNNAINVCNEWSDNNPVGWYFVINSSDRISEVSDEYCGKYGKERVISTPTLVEDENIVIFTTMKPCFDVNSKVVAKTHIWVLNCALGTGTGISCGKFKVGNPKGEILIQTSTGEIAEVNLGRYNSETGMVKGGLYGGPGEQGAIYLKNANVKNIKTGAGRILLWLEY